MPFVGLTKPAIVTTPNRSDPLCYDFQSIQSVPLTHPVEQLRY